MDSKEYVVFKGNLFYRSDKEMTADLQNSKSFTSQATAKRVAKRIEGNYREVINKK